jgi:hypothetical protein
MLQDPFYLVLPWGAWWTSWWPTSSSLSPSVRFMDLVCRLCSRMLEVMWPWVLTSSMVGPTLRFIYYDCIFLIFGASAPS